MDTGLGEFLRSRRARLRPEDVGLVNFGARRRVPGLRREEIAQLAGVSVAYYTRLEQGQSLNASDAVLDAIARVLQLDDDERTALYDHARQQPRARRRTRPENLRPGIRQMIESFDRVPAAVIGRRSDVLAWNRMAHALLAGHLAFDAPSRPADRPNLARLVFLDPHTRELYADWRRKSRDAVAYLRMSAARYPDDPKLSELVGELSVHSPEFAALWSAHPVRECASNVREYQHPLVGSLTLRDELLRLPDDEGQRVVVYNAEPASTSEAGLRLLAELIEDRTVAADHVRKSQRS
jgi:transcriptional regulator with XRE-family HTH domain